MQLQQGREDMNHTFDIEHAIKYGIPEAVMISNFQYWITKNRANGVHFYDGRTWTYNSVSAFSEIFPYMSEKQVRRAIASLIKESVLMTGNYNKAPTNHTLWYAFCDESKFLPEDSDLPKRANRIAQEGKSCFAQKGKSTNKETNINADSKHKSIGADAPKYSPQATLEELGVDEQTIADWIEHRKLKRASTSMTVIKDRIKEAALAGMSLADALSMEASRGWQGFHAGWVLPKQSGVAPAMNRQQSLEQRNREIAERLARGEA
jgi:hypothetical protein